MELESLNTKVANGTDKEGRKMSITIQGVIIVPMFGLVGQVSYQGSLKGASVTVDEEGSSAVEAVVANDGNGRLIPHGKYEITDASGAVATHGESGLYGYVMPGTERLFSVKLTDPLPAGKYTLRIEFTSSGLKEPLKREVAFDWVPPPPPKAPPAAGAAASGTAAVSPSPAPTSPPATSTPPSPELAAPPATPAAGQ
jgi:hypothetical protein